MMFDTRTKLVMVKSSTGVLHFKCTDCGSEYWFSNKRKILYDYFLDVVLTLGDLDAYWTSIEERSNQIRLTLESSNGRLTFFSPEALICPRCRARVPRESLLTFRGKVLPFHLKFSEEMDQEWDMVLKNGPSVPHVLTGSAHERIVGSWGNFAEFVDEFEQEAQEQRNRARQGGRLDPRFPPSSVSTSPDAYPAQEYPY